MGRTFFRSANLIDGINPPRKNSVVVVEDERITTVSSEADAPAPSANDVIFDLDGRSLMPGMVQCHYHVAYDNVGNLIDLDLKHPATMLTLIAAKNAELLLRCGFTGAVVAGSLHNIDVTLKQAINRGLIQGPRFVACGRDIVTTGDSVDFHPSWWKLEMEGLGRICDGPDEFRKAVRDGGRHHRERAARQGVAGVLHVLQHHAHQHHERRPEALRLLDRPLEQDELLDALHVHLAAVAHHLGDLGQRLVVLGKPAPSAEPEKTLLARHKAGGAESLSGFLLSELGVAEKKIAKNQYGDKVPFSIRHFVPYLLTEETDMIGEASPIKISDFKSPVLDKNVLKFIVTGLDDSAIVVSIDDNSPAAPLSLQSVKERAARLGVSWSTNSSSGESR